MGGTLQLREFLMLWPLEQVHQALLAVFARILLFELDFGTWYNGKGIGRLRLDSSYASELLRRWYWLVQLRVVKTLHRLVGDSVPLWVHIVVKDRQVESLCHFDLHATVMHASVVLVRREAGRDDRVIQGTINSDHATWLVNWFDHWPEERATIAIILLESIGARALLCNLLAIVDGPAHLFLI